MFKDEYIKTNILLVDDQPANLLAIEAILDPLGQNLVKAHSGREALKYLLTMEFSVILLDVQMPEMDGFETARLIKERAKSRHIPIIFLTAISKEETYVFKGYTVGAVDYMLKPFEPDILRSKVSVFIDLFRKSEQIKWQAEALRQRREREVDEYKKETEQRYRDLAESMPHMVWTSDAKGKLTYCNRRWFESAGLAPDAAVELDWALVLAPQDKAAFLTQLRNALEAKRDWECEWRFGNEEGGEFRWHLVRALPVRGDGDEVVSWIGTNTDIDDRKRAEAAVRVLAEASTLLSESLDYEAALARVARLAVPTLGDGCAIWLQDADGAVRKSMTAHVDPKMQEVLDEILLRGPTELFKPTGAPELVRLADAEDSHLALVRELGLRSYLCVPIRARNRVLGAIALFTDDSERRYSSSDVTVVEDLARRAAAAIDVAQLYAIAQREKVRLEEVNRAKDEFLATLSHELRTPLNAMLGWTQILRTRKVDETKFAHGLETIERNAKAQAQLIADLLDVSRIIAGKLSVETNPVSMAQLVEDCLDAARPQAESRKLVLESTIDTSLGDVLGDRGRLQQIIMNLVSNALKFTPTGGKVHVTLERHDGRARVRVTDTGQGINPAFLPYVFDRFRQADSTIARTHGGLGLGLSIVKHLAELHGGTVSATSEGTGKGAAFTVELPIAPAAQKSVPGAAAGSDGVGKAVGEALRGLHVVLAEDDQDGRELLQTMIENCGARVTAFASAGATVDYLTHANADLLISDIGLPNEDGYTLIKRVRALPADKNGKIPAIALTAYASAEDRERAINAGFHGHLAKPIQPNELIAALSRLVEREGARDKEKAPAEPAKTKALDSSSRLN